ncbi:MAG: cAMP-dependent protein kinase [Verrucomicrobia bacterium]|jgi:CRP-like cAMP-binding protein|nr:MAG: cAMP-dependent protein kinase [Verrucomicrobiota bacterium]
MSQTEPPDLPALGFARDLSDDERRQLSAYGDFTAAEDGQAIIVEGRPQDSLSMVVSGTVHVQTEAGGRHVLLSSLRAGDVIGEVNIFDPSEASATVVASGFAVLWSISRSKLDAFMHYHPAASSKVLLSIATTLSKKLRRTNEKAAVQQQLAQP